jgi:hypothetical protein
MPEFVLVSAAFFGFRDAEGGVANTHKATWAEAAREQPRDIRSKPWNHFPRGRVYHNPALGSPEFEQRIRDAFALDALTLSVRFVPDHSNHYWYG